jgi:hypothetical protein
VQAAAAVLLPLQDRGTVSATGRQRYFRKRSLTASIIRAWTVVSRSSASCRSAFNPSRLIRVKMPRAATGALACAAFVLRRRLYTMPPSSQVTRPVMESSKPHGEELPLASNANRKIFDRLVLRICIEPQISQSYG